MNIYKNIRLKYGRETLHEARFLEKVTTQTASWTNHLTFNHRCKQLTVTPPSLRLFTTARGQAARRVTANAERKLLQIRIGHCHERLRCLRTSTLYTTATLTSTLTKDEMDNLTDAIQHKAKETHDITKERQKRKLDRLITPKPPPPPHPGPPQPPHHQPQRPMVI
jgi:hypothetical protein